MTSMDKTNKMYYLSIAILIMSIINLIITFLK